MSESPTAEEINALVPQYHATLIAAVIVVAVELLALATLRWRFYHTRFLYSLLSIALGGAITTGLSAALGSAG